MGYQLFKLRKKLLYVTLSVCRKVLRFAIVIIMAEMVIMDKMAIIANLDQIAIMAIMAIITTMNIMSSGNQSCASKPSKIYFFLKKGKN